MNNKAMNKLKLILITMINMNSYASPKEIINMKIFATNTQ